MVLVPGKLFFDVLQSLESIFPSTSDKLKQTLLRINQNILLELIIIERCINKLKSDISLCTNKLASTSYRNTSCQFVKFGKMTQ